jgi:hypothetical protein
MKLLVPVKRAIDDNVKIRVEPDGSGDDVPNVKMSMSPFNEIAVEEARRLKESGKVEEFRVVSIDPAQSLEPSPGSPDRPGCRLRSRGRSLRDYAGAGKGALT